MKKFLLALLLVLTGLLPAAAQFADQATFVATAGGTANAITVALPNATALSDVQGVVIKYLPTATNTGPTTLNVSGTGVKNILKYGPNSLVALTGNEIVNGSIAVVVSNAAYAADCPNRPIRVEAIGGSSGAGGWVHRPDYPKMGSVDAAAEMWSRTDLKPSDLDIAELYDGFTFLTFGWLEALGVCGDGESGPFVEGGGRIALDGALPLNTYGGQLSAGRMHGYWVLHEACVQLRGDAGERQVRRQPEVAVVSNGGGPIAGCMLLTR